MNRLPRGILNLRPSINSRFAIRRLHTSPHLDEGLKILFCGSDRFSLKSLEALTDLKKREPDIIDSITVLCKNEANSGRGHKDKRLNPVQYFAQNHMRLDPLEIDSFDGWRPPHSIDLIVAVSFGMFIPANLIESATHGGLNVHPSFLPKYRGSAPLHHALLNGDESTGVVVQTLDKFKFDRGKILAKSDPVNIDIDTSKFYPPKTQWGSHFNTLQDKLAVEGARLLTQTIYDGNYLPIIQEILPEITTGNTPSLASRLKTSESEIKFGETTAEEVLRKSLVFDYLYSFRHRWKQIPDPPKRMLFSGFRRPTDAEWKQLRYLEETVQWAPAGGSHMGGSGKGALAGMALQVSPRNWVVVKHLTVEGGIRNMGFELAKTMDRKKVILASSDFQATTASPDKPKWVTTKD